MAGAMSDTVNIPKPLSFQEYYKAALKLNNSFDMGNQQPITEIGSSATGNHE